MKTTIMLFLLALPSHADARTTLYITRDMAVLDFDTTKPFLTDSQQIDVQFSASLFKLLLEKSEKMWWSGKYLCILPDGDGMVGDNISREAEGYGYAVLPDIRGKKCGSDKVKETK